MPNGPLLLHRMASCIRRVPFGTCQLESFPSTTRAQQHLLFLWRQDHSKCARCCSTYRMCTISPTFRGWAVCRQRARRLLSSAGSLTRKSSRQPSALTQAYLRYIAFSRRSRYAELSLLLMLLLSSPSSYCCCCRNLVSGHCSNDQCDWSNLLPLLLQVGFLQLCW